MADYAKSSLYTIYSANSDYSDPSINSVVTKELTTPTERLDITLGASTGGVTVTLSTFTTLTNLTVINLSSTIVTTITYKTGGGGGSGGTTQTIAIPVSDFVRLVDVTAAGNLTLTSASGTPLIHVIAYGT